MAFRHWFLGLLAAVSTGAALPIVAQGIASAAPIAKGTDPGEVLMGELQCIACHGADRAIADRLGNHPAPLLGAAGLRLEPQWIRAWLANPSASKPGTAMPHVLHGLPEATRNLPVNRLSPRPTAPASIWVASCTIRWVALPAMRPWIVRRTCPMTSSSAP